MDGTHTEDHASRENYAPGDDLYDDVQPEDRVLEHIPQHQLVSDILLKVQTSGSGEMTAPSGILSS